VPKIYSLLDHDLLLSPGASPEAVALTVHLKDVAVMGKTVKKSTGKSFIAGDFFPAGVLQVGGDDKRVTFISIRTQVHLPNNRLDAQGDSDLGEHPGDGVLKRLFLCGAEVVAGAYHFGCAPAFFLS